MKSYIRPFAFYNDPNIGLDVTGRKISVIIATVPLKTYSKIRIKG